MELIVSEEDRKKRRKKELIQEAFQQLMEVKKQKQKEKGLETEEEEEEEDLLISRLLMQLDSVEKDGDSTHSIENSHEQEEPETETKPESASVRNVGKSRTEEADLSEMAKGLRRVKRQNLITHCLLSVIVVGIAVWQVSEVSFLLTVKEKFSNPLRAVGDAIRGSIKWREKKEKKQKLQIEGPSLLQIEGPSLPAVGVSELTLVDLPKLILKDED